ncbi:MAG: tetratricopeptide repeat protein [Bacteroidales bacterium]|nr:tetratricopeptide repeat protein [Bacteroidales bacterium]
MQTSVSKNNKKHVEKSTHAPYTHTSDSWLKRLIVLYNEKQKVVNIVTIVVFALVVLALAYFLYYMPSQQQKAETAIFKAERYFAMDSLELALNGDGLYDGVLQVIDDYSATKTGNRAKYIAGICYLRLGQYDDAIKYLKKFKSGDKLISVQALGSLGDAYMEKNDLDNAAKYYKKAVSKNANELVTPIYLLRLGMLCEMQGKWKDAVSYYERLQKEYMQSFEAMDIEKRIEYTKAKSRS